MQKNDIIKLTITDMSVNGEGIGRISGMPFFVAGAVSGDEITAAVTKLKKTYGYARIISVDTPSQDRVTPACSIASRCGGCRIMSMSYTAQLAWKESFVENTLMRIAGIPKDTLIHARRPIVCMDDPYHFRNKSQYPVGTDRYGNIAAGFYAPRSHRIIPIITSNDTLKLSGDSLAASDVVCMIAPQTDKRILSEVLMYMTNENIKPYDETTGRGQIRHILIRHGFSTKEIMVCIIVNANRLPCEELLVDKLLQIDGISSIVINTNKRRDNVILGEHTRTVYGNSYIEDILLDNRFRISARSFFQVNPVQTAKLYKKAIEYACLNGTETVWDLYCGIGTISLSAARSCARVIGIETVPDAIRDAEKNARINNINNAYFICGNAEDVLNNTENEKMLEQDPDVIIVDPPRKGLDPVVAEAMIRRSPERIVYISCNPSTLARDLRLILSAGYDLEEYTPYDQFCHSSHVESCVLLQRVSNTRPKAITLDVEMEDYYRIKGARTND